MSWKHIAKSVAGTSHVAMNRGCEDASLHTTVVTADNEEVLICCISDGAGSSLYGDWASDYITATALEIFTHKIQTGERLTDVSVYELMELLYKDLEKQAADNKVMINEYSATFLGAIIYIDQAIFFQIGDGAIIRNDGTDFYSPVFRPQNGEYQNTTNFLVDNPSFPQLQCIKLQENVNEIALFTDGLQQLALSVTDETVHQPFFASLFPALRKAEQKEYILSLANRLADYLDSPAINDRTDDDKTLLLATRIPA